MRLAFRRIQFTPDLVPSDITGSEVMEEARGAGTRAFRFVEGPVFANVVLADEINRAPPRTQAALLEAMQEHAVSAAGRTMPLPEPFFVLATQNPIEQEGTYPLPEAQLDRFLFDVRVGYPAADDEVAILRATTGAAAAPLAAGARRRRDARPAALARARGGRRAALRYAAALVRATRPARPGRAGARARRALGRGPRAGQALVLGAKAHALLAGRRGGARRHPRVAAPVLRHRVLPTFAAEARGWTWNRSWPRCSTGVAAPRSGVGLWTARAMRGRRPEVGGGARAEVREARGERAGRCGACGAAAQVRVRGDWLRRLPLRAASRPRRPPTLAPPRPALSPRHAPLLDWRPAHLGGARRCATASYGAAAGRRRGGVARGRPGSAEVVVRPGSRP
jgi:MoxR-like ATPase